MDIIPTDLDDFIINNKIALCLKSIDLCNLPNIIFYGKNNSGKKTLVDAFLNHLFKKDILSYKKMESTDIRIGNNKVDIDYIRTPYHIEINLYEYGLYDKDIITDFIYELIKFKSINSPIKIIVINHFDEISPTAQCTLRRMIEKTYKNARFMCIVEDLTKLDRSVLSRFYNIRVPFPKKENLHEYVNYISKNKYKFSQPQIKKILNTCENNMYLLHHIIISSINNSKFNYGKFDNINRDLIKIYKLVNLSNISSILEIRSICYNLLLLNFSMKELFNKIAEHFIPLLKEEVKLEFVREIANINYKMANTEHDIISIEYLILKVKKALIFNK